MKKLVRSILILFRNVFWYMDRRKKLIPVIKEGDTLYPISLKQCREIWGDDSSIFTSIY